MADQNAAAADGGSHYMAAQPIVLQQTDADMWRETAAAAAGHGGIGASSATKWGRGDCSTDRTGYYHYDSQRQPHTRYRLGRNNYRGGDDDDY